MEIIEPPRIVERAEMPYLGIRVVTPFRGMLATRDRLLDELYTWIDRNDEVEAVRFFLRLHVVDMSGSMDIEVGVSTAERVAGDDRVRPGVLPAGHYATLTYRDHSIRANRALIEWTRAQGVPFDRSDDPAGDRFACRYEAFVTDPRTEPRKTRWIVELNFRVIQPGQTKP
jgi:effector-binding domain-containing protein